MQLGITQVRKNLAKWTPSRGTNLAEYFQDSTARKQQQYAIDREGNSERIKKEMKQLRQVRNSYMELVSELKKQNRHDLVPTNQAKVDELNKQIEELKLSL